jgi:capsular exopolysaccharide synthesis family protein
MAKGKTKHANGKHLETAELREAFNKIKLNIDFTTVDNPKKVLIVSSSLMAEGKTSVAVNTAISMASASSKTLLVDADMRQPRVHKLFGISNIHGLSDVIAGDADWRKCLKDVAVQNLSVLTSGRKPPNPSELLGSQRMMALIDELRDEFKYVVFDSPPVLPVPDTLSLSKYTDGIILVVRHHYSNFIALRQCKESMKLANAKMIGAVVNDVPARDKGYGYSYGYGYGAADEPMKAAKSYRITGSGLSKAGGSHPSAGMKSYR